MDKEHVKGAADKAKGAMKDVAGKLTDDKELQAEGKMDKAKGGARQAMGDAKDAVKQGAGQRVARGALSGLGGLWTALFLPGSGSTRPGPAVTHGMPTRDPT